MSDGPRALPEDAGAADDALAERLRAALTPSLQAQVPADLVGATMAAVGAERQARTPHRLLLLGGIAAAVAIAVGIGASIGRSPGLEPTGRPAATVAAAEPTAGTATPAHTPAASPTFPPAATAPTSSQAAPPAGEPAFPSVVDGLPVLAVSEALAARDDPAGAAEPVRVAVRGWLAEAPPLPCPAPVGPSSPLVGSCPDAYDALMERREQLGVPNGFHGPSKDNPSLNPRFLSVERTFDPRLATFLAAPLPVVLVGHFHDGAAASCDASLRAACRQAFVVERVAWVDGIDTATAPAGPVVIDCPIKDCTAIVTALRAVRDKLAAAQRVVIATGCPPWVFCTFQPAVRVLVVPQGWRGLAADVGVYDVGSGAGAAVTQAHTSLDDWSLARAGGYTVQCPAASVGMYAPDCYRIAVGAATAALRQSGVPIASIAVHGKCGGYDVLRTDGTAVSVNPSCLAPPASPAPDARLTCRSSACLAAAAAVARADPDAYAAAARIAFVPACAPWMRCRLIPGGMDVVVLEPAGWEGDPAGVRSWRVSSPGSGALVATPIPSLGAYQLTVVGGYPVTCAGGMLGAACYERAAAAAADEWQRGHVAIAGVTVRGPCGDVEVLRVDGTVLTTQSVCVAPSPIASPSPGP